MSAVDVAGAATCFKNAPLRNTLYPLTPDPPGLSTAAVHDTLNWLQLTAAAFTAAGADGAMVSLAGGNKPCADTGVHERRQEATPTSASPHRLVRLRVGAVVLGVRADNVSLITISTKSYGFILSGITTCRSGIATCRRTRGTRGRRWGNEENGAPPCCGPSRPSPGRIDARKAAV